MPNCCLLATLADDPHTQGLFRVARLARKSGVPCTVLPPGTPDEAILEAVHAEDPEWLGLSYRLSPEKGVAALVRILERLRDAGLLRRRHAAGLRQVAFAGLPETVAAVDRLRGQLPCPVTTVAQADDPLRPAAAVLEFLRVPAGLQAERLAELRAELFPPGIPELDGLAQEVVAHQAYRDEPPLPVPSAEARRSYVTRIREADLPILRTHFGIPAPGIAPTVTGIERLADARAVDEISLGSSDLSQRWFGHPEEFERRKNDGGVPYRTPADLSELAAAAQRGNFPAMKPYAHVVDLVGFVDTCLRTGQLVGAHQAVPLYWFNELDGRGPMTVPESIVEHQAAVQALARRGLPVEMNDPNQWSSRWAHDAVFCADYGLITAVMREAGVRDLVLQMQVSKPRETGDLGDLAKMTTSLELAREVLPAGPAAPAIWRETRTGIDSLDPSPDRARWQLARSTLLQMILAPHAIHIVSYCEADHVATAEDVIDSSALVRRAIRVFRRHAPDLLRSVDLPAVAARRAVLLEEGRLLLRAIAALAPGPAPAPDAPLSALAERLARPPVLAAAIERGLVAAPGIFHPRYHVPGLVTGPVAGGFIDCLDPDTGERLPEATRLARLGA
jgi:hypothetical protein